MFAEVAPAIPLTSAAGSQTYTYRVPQKNQATVAVGSRVTIPLGRQLVSGTILRLHTNRVPYPTKTLTLHEDPPLTTGQIEFATWISTTLHGGLGYTLRLFFPPSRIGPIKSNKKRSSTRPSRSVSQTDVPASIIEKNDLQRFARIRECITADGTHKQVLLLVPEVSLAAPLQKALVKSFNEVVVYHSDRTPQQVAAVWQAVYEDKSIVVIGTQKALYLPWRTLTHVVIEEEYLDTHKLWDQYPRLDNRYAAPALARLHGSHVCTASSALSPALAWSQVAESMAGRSVNPVAPKIKSMPLRFQDRQQGHVLPPPALEHIRAGLKKREKILLLHNQRGSWRTAMCAKCHHVLRCPECNSTVFVEGARNKQRVHCRQCAYTAPFPPSCPDCGNARLRVFGPGAARVADVVQTLVPKARLVEVAAGHIPAVSTLEKADIVVGTTAIWRATSEMVFHRALWLFPESTILYPDYRSSERAWEIMVRLQKKISSRRAVAVVTRYPDLIQQTLAVSPEKFMQQLLKERGRLKYPPIVDLVRLTKYGRSETAALAAGRVLREKLEADKPPTVTIRGPYQGFNKKEDGKFAIHFLLTGPLEELVPLYKNLPVDRADLSPAQIL